ncbi:CHAT domain-containing protein [Tychonema bourrellyi FEM_GT703]|uniref:CHAT domain-containing protein n=2 Tax=Tychonema bourrellyi TaxID=54313 RepID=A0A2G4EYT2_9CYAN|nr:CHAT domain-containing protein [Tychonema bourrellyi FEM_GT703]
MLTGGGDKVNASDVAVSSDGTVKLTNAAPKNSPPNNLVENNSAAVPISPQPTNVSQSPTNTVNQNSPPNNSNGGISAPPTNTVNQNSPPNNSNGGTSAPPTNTGNQQNSPPNNSNGGISGLPNNTGNQQNSPPNNSNEGTSAPPTNTGNQNSPSNNSNEGMSPEPNNTGNQNSPSNNSNGGNAQIPGNALPNNSASPTVFNANISAPNNSQPPMSPPGMADIIRVQGNRIQNSLLPNIQPNSPINGQIMPNNNFGLIPNNIQILSSPPILNSQPGNPNILQNSFLPNSQTNSLINGQIISKSQPGVSPNNNIQVLASPGTIVGNSPQPAASNPQQPGGGNTTEMRGRSGENLPPGVPNIPSGGANPGGNLAAISNMNYLLSVEQNRADRYSAYFGESLTNEPMAAENIRETLGKISSQTGKRSAIIYINLFSDRLELLLFTPDGSAIRKTVSEADRTTVLELAKEFRQEISNPRKRNTNSYKESARNLYDRLIAPLEADLQSQGINTLLFSLDTGLRSLPLAALYDGKQFLVEKYSLSQIPTISLTDTRYQSLQNASVLAMGAAQFTKLSPLPAVPIELANIADLWPGKSFLNEQFTLNNLKSQRSQRPYQIIHLATHGEFQPGTASDSFIQLWDSKLQLNQLRQLGWNNPPVELLVLSACRTALGDEETELGFAGLAFQAGVKSALASLWYVSDEGTLALMSEFYQQLKTAPIKAEALRQAQIAMLKGDVRIEQGVLRGLSAVSFAQGTRGGTPLPAELANMGDRNLAHPYYWAAFTMIGSPW